MHHRLNLLKINKQQHSSIPAIFTDQNSEGIASRPRLTQVVVLISRRAKYKSFDFEKSEVSQIQYQQHSANKTETALSNNIL